MLWNCQESGLGLWSKLKSMRNLGTLIASGAFALLLIISVPMVVMPYYRVWSQQMRGKAAFAEAEQNRRIQIEEAKANLESQKLNSEAEVVRAKGMAESIAIENGKLTPLYIQYLWVRNIDKMDGQKIYIPTEANMPILEASQPAQ